MIVIGGGVIGLELGSVYTITEVTVIEHQDSLYYNGSYARKELLRSLKKIGMKFQLSTSVKSKAAKV